MSDDEPKQIASFSIDDPRVAEMIDEELDKAVSQFTSSYNKDSITGFDVYETGKEVSSFDESTLYQALIFEWKENDFAQFLVRRLVNKLMDFKLVGSQSDVKQVQDFFYRTNVVYDLEQVVTQAFVIGTGMLQRFMSKGELARIARVDASTVQLERKRNARGEFVYKFTQFTGGEDEEGNMNTQPLVAKHMAMFKPTEEPDNKYGISYLRGSLLALQAIRQLQKDIPAGIKRLAYATLVMYLDLDNVSDEAEARRRIRRAIATFYKHDSATNTVTAMDKNHKLEYVGSGGGSQPSIVPLLPIIEPILMALLVKWHVPMGMFLQEKSNRALIQSQSIEANKEIIPLQKKFAQFLEREVLTYMFGDDPDERPPVRIEHNVNLADMVDEMDRYLQMVQLGIIPVEAFVEKFGISIPEGELTYLAGPEADLSNQEAPEEPEIEPGTPPEGEGNDD